MVITLMALAAAGTVEADRTWRGLTVAPEHRCAPYDRDDYPYSQSVEARIIASMGSQVYSPYTGVEGQTGLVPKSTACCRGSGETIG